MCWGLHVGLHPAPTREHLHAQQSHVRDGLGRLLARATTSYVKPHRSFDWNSGVPMTKGRACVMDGAV